MTLTCTSDRYGSVAISIHWLSAVLILILLVSGFRAAAADDVGAKMALLRIHLPAAALVLALTVLRIVWWFLYDTKPDPIVDCPPLLDRVAGAVHLFLYLVIFGMIASGVGMMVASAAVPIIAGVDFAPLPDFWRFRPRVPHGVGAKLMLALLAVHIAAALYHHYVRRDQSMRRIWYRRDTVSSNIASSNERR